MSGSKFLPRLHRDWLLLNWLLWVMTADRGVTISVLPPSGTYMYDPALLPPLSSSSVFPQFLRSPTELLDSARTSLRTLLVGPSQLLQASASRMALKRMSSSACKPATFNVARGSGGPSAGAAAATGDSPRMPTPAEGDEEGGRQGSHVLKYSPLLKAGSPAGAGTSSLPSSAAATSAEFVVPSSGESAGHRRAVVRLTLPTLSEANQQPARLMEVVAQAMEASGRGHEGGHTSEALNPLYSLVSVLGPSD